MRRDRRGTTGAHLRPQRARRCLRDRDDAAALGHRVAQLVTDLRTLLLPSGPSASPCTAAQLTATRSTLARVLQAHLRDLRLPEASRLAAALSAAGAHLDAAFARAARRGACLSPVGDDAVFALLAQAARDLRDLLGAPCPCWTTALIDRFIPPGFFDLAGRGGAVCTPPVGPPPGDAPSIRAADTCRYYLESGEFLGDMPRGGITLTTDRFCSVVGDGDPGNTGVCNQGNLPMGDRVTTAEAAACAVALRTSQVYRSSCP